MLILREHGSHDEQKSLDGLPAKLPQTLLCRSKEEMGASWCCHEGKMTDVGRNINILTKGFVKIYI